MLAVTTDAPDSSAARMSDRAGSIPPITSITTSTSPRRDQCLGVGGEELARDVDARGPVDPAYGDADQLEGRPDAGDEVAGLLGEQARHLAADDAAAEQGDANGLCSSSRLPAFRPRVETPLDECPSFAERADLRRRIRHARCHPSQHLQPQQILLRLAAYDSAAWPSRHRDDGGARHMVVGVGEATGSRRRSPARRAGRPARRRTGRNSSLTTMSPDSQCLPTTRDKHRRGLGPAGGERAGEVGVVQRGSDVVAHPAVDGDVEPARSGVQRHRLDRSDLVEGERRRARRSRGPARSTGAGRRCRAPGTRARRSR